MLNIIATLKYVLPRHSIDIAIGGQVCFYRRLFADPLQPLRACGVLLGINKVALRYQWAPYVHLGPCHDLGPLWLFLSAPDQMARLPGSQVRWTHPPTLPPPPSPPPSHPPTTLPSPLPPTYPLIHDTHDITETFQKTFTKPVILTSCQLVHIMLAITLVYYWSKSGMATIKHQRNTVL